MTAKQTRRVLTVPYGEQNIAPSEPVFNRGIEFRCKSSFVVTSLPILLWSMDEPLAELVADTHQEEIQSLGELVITRTEEDR